jgi:flavin-dependent dehydrogenase
VIRRAEFDNALARAATDRGIAIRERVRVLKITREPDRIVVHTSVGDLSTRVLIGADGVGSVVRREVGAPTGTWRAQVLEVDTEPTRHDLARDLFHFDVSDRQFPGYAWDFPTIVDGRELVSRGVYQLTIPGAPAPSGSLNERLAARLEAVGLDLSRCRKKRFAERGFSPHEASAYPRIILIGEAAGIDPITGEGIAQAVLYGQALAPYLVDRLERNAMVFDDWATELRKTRLGIDLWLREQLARRFFGAPREFYERSLLAIPEFLEAGMQYFAGERVSRSLMLKIAATATMRMWEQREMRPWAGLTLRGEP